MTYPLNSQYNPNLQPTMGYTNGMVAPLDKEQVRTTVNSSMNQNKILKRAKEDDNPALLAGLMAPTWAGISWAMSKFNKACASEADGGKDVLRKVANWGDKQAERPIFNNKYVEKSQGYFKTAKTFIRNKVIDKSKILTAIVDTPTAPVSKVPKTTAGGTLTELAADVPEVFEKFEASGKSFEKYGFSKELIEKIKKKPQEHIKDIIKICDKVGDAGAVRLGRTKFFGRDVYFTELGSKMKALQGLKGNFAKTNVGKGITKGLLRGLEGLTNGTAGGKFAIAMQAFIISNSIKLAIEAPWGEKGKTFAENLIYDLGWYLTMPLSMAAMHGAGGLQHLGLKKGVASTKVPSNLDEALKVAKQTKKVKDYEVALEQFNKKAETPGGFANKAEWKAARKELREAFMGDIPKFKDMKSIGDIKGFFKAMHGTFIHRPLKRAASILAVGLGTVKHYTPKEYGFVKSILVNGATKISIPKFIPAAEAIERGIVSLFKDARHTLKRASGYPMRMGLFALKISPFFGLFGAKLSHLLFGKPTKSVLDEGKEEPAPQQMAQAQPNMQMRPQQMQPIPQQQVAQMQQQVQPQLQQQAQPQMQQMAQPQVAPQPSVANVNNSNNVANAKPSGPVRTYIPSPVGVKVNPNSLQAGIPNHKILTAFDKSKFAEQRALDVLAMDS